LQKIDKQRDITGALFVLKIKTGPPSGPLLNHNTPNQIGQYVDRISREDESKWDELLDMLPEEPAYQGMSNQTLKQKIHYELEMLRRRRECWDGL